MKQWPHAPIHILEKQGAYMVSCGTYQKLHLLNSPERFSLVESTLFDVAQEFGWRLQAWALLSNHYHFVALSPEDPKNLSVMISKLHTKTAIELNRQDKTQGRRVWFQYYDTHITYQTSYLARLNYVHNNPAHHGIVGDSENYSWCSAAWFARRAAPSFRKTVASFKTDRVKVMDDFDVVRVERSEARAVRSTEEEEEKRQSGVKPPHSESR
jgi:putative transposase